MRKEKDPPIRGDQGRLVVYGFYPSGTGHGDKKFSYLPVRNTFILLMILDFPLLLTLL